ncbi:hypothetical protein [Moraxella marmotae]|uniref:hypothetical protein n=1 Tax=Moraxella marmotae TaxID=3344520 RepID=UPI0035F29D8A
MFCILYPVLEEGLVIPLKQCLILSSCLDVFAIAEIGFDGADFVLIGDNSSIGIKFGGKSC